MPIFYSKTSFKVTISYAILILLVSIFSVIFFEQLKVLNWRNTETYDHTNASFLLSNTLNDLLELESIKQQYLEKPTSTNFNRLKDKYEGIIEKTRCLRKDDFQKDFDKIESLLTSKIENLIALRKLYQRQNTSDYFGKAVAQLKQLDTLPNNLKDVKTTKSNRIFRRVKRIDQKKVIEKKVAKIDSVVENVSSRLKQLAIKERQIKQRISNKEDELLQKDIILNRKIRGILYHLEKQAFLQYKKQLKESKIQLKEAIWAVGLSSLFTLFAGGVFFFLIRRDLIRSTKNELALVAANEKTQEALKSKENLIQMVSHDIRSPLQQILGNLEMIDSTTISNKYKNRLNEMHYASTYILNLVTDLLYFFKGKNIKIAYSNFNPKTLITNITKQILPYDNPKNLNIEITIGGALDENFSSDPYRIEQVLNNVLSNAYKFTEKGSIHILAKKENKQGKDNINIEIRDTGVGINKTLQKHISKRFERGNFEDSHKDGFGLGLFITKFLVDELKGEFVLESKENKGTRVIISLPLLKPEEQDISNSKIESIPTDTLIYVIDDDVSYLNFIKAFLTKVNIECNVFSSAENALNKLAEKQPNLIITDLNMPIIDGITFLDKVKTGLKSKTIPVIVFTGEVLHDDSYFQKMGFAAKITKPASADMIKKTIFQILNKEEKKPVLPEYADDNYAIPEIYDLTESLKMLEGDTVALSKLLVLFIENALEAIALLESQIKTENKIEIHQIVHKIIPLFKQFKMDRSVAKLHYINSNNYSENKANTAISILKKDLYLLREMSATLS